MAVHLLQQLNDLHARARELETAWLRQLLTLAAGALAVLVGLAPPATGIGKWFLAAAWLSLGAAICSGALAIGQQAVLEKARANAFQEELMRSLDEGRSPRPVVSTLPPLYRIARSTMLVSLLASVAFLVVYAVLRTLS
ncbi:hypothetical protein [Thiofaba sp. EF100]|uniref:hypothetical protein n=1 Tax=Thiofaba sp. EF100 TaxID=3121274 RepID=UPI00322176F1